MVGTDRRISLFELAARAKEMKARGEIAEDLDTKTTAETPQTFPNGCHVAEVEIDPDTGQLRSSATPPSTTAATSSTTGSSRVSSTARWRWGSARR